MFLKFYLFKEINNSHMVCLVDFYQSVNSVRITIRWKVSCSSSYCTIVYNDSLHSLELSGTHEVVSCVRIAF